MLIVKVFTVEIHCTTENHSGSEDQPEVCLIQNAVSRMRVFVSNWTH